MDEVKDKDYAFELNIYRGSNKYSNRLVVAEAFGRTPKELSDLLISIALSIRGKTMPRDEKGRFVRKENK